ncbi:MAG: transglutaminase domain-containing protein [Rubrivivax sp.]|nr:transglutaminase domain-containing protein [Pyrinomonadaceae bacterium]
MNRPALSVLTYTLALFFLALGLREGVRQYREDLYVRAATQEALSGSAGSDHVSKVRALQEFVRGHVHNANFSARNRPFFRDSAADTLAAGKGRCGEATRLFINMASAAGISARRLYLEGRKPHVVAVVVADDGSRLVIDSSDQPYLPEIESFESLQRSPQFTAYSTFGFRRLAALRALPSHDVNLGPLNYVLENPHALIACLWLLPSLSLFGLTELLRRRVISRNRADSERKISVMGGLSGGAEV